MRDAAVARGSAIAAKAREGLTGGSAPESDFYEELFVNPTILGIAGRRGGLDCGGLRYVVVSYGLFNQIVVPIEDGHVSVAVEHKADARAVAEQILGLLEDGVRRLRTSREISSQNSGAEPPVGLPRYRLLTGPDDEAFCRRVSEALHDGYVLSGSPFGTFDGGRTIVGQALVWPG